MREKPWILPKGSGDSFSMNFGKEKNIQFRAKLSKSLAIVSPCNSNTS
jgi:hypothetical protein